MKRDDSVYLSHILDSISQLEEYTEGLTKEEFLARWFVQDGTIRQIEIVGEAIKNVSETLKVRYPDIPWKEIAGMRDKLIHNYFGVDINAVWDAVKKDIPILNDEILKIMEISEKVFNFISLQSSSIFLKVGCGFQRERRKTQTCSTIG